MRQASKMLRRGIPPGFILTGWLVAAAGQAQSPPSTAIPHVEQRGIATQLIVDGKPYLWATATLHVDLRRNRRNPSQVPAFGYGLFLMTGPDEYLCAGTDIQVTFTPTSPGPEIAGLADAEAGVSVVGRWVPGRKMSGDDILLRYDLAAAEINQSGSGLRFNPDGPTIQRVRLYRYQ